MKKNLLTLLLLATVSMAYAQKDSVQVNSKTAGRNEVRLNLFNSILGMPEISYERVFKDNTGAGVSILVGVDDDIDYSFGAIPYYRVYFGNSKRASGFFIEANAAYMQLNEKMYLMYNDANGNWRSTSTNTKASSFGLGAAAGGKFLTKSGFVGEAYFGLGRLFNKNASLEVYPRIGITLGKRF